MNYRIKEILKERGIRIEDFANEIEVKRETLSRIINGASTSTETLERIADRLNIHITELYDKPIQKDDNQFICPKCGTRLEVKEKE